MEWLRYYHDTPTDPKWRVVAAETGLPVHAVVAVWDCMLVCASQAETRGTLESWNDRVVAAALDLKAADVLAIRTAMQGLTLDGDRLTGWAKRQPKREDGAAERAKAWRDRKRAELTANDRDQTQANASERAGTQTIAREEEIREEDTLSNDKGASAPALFAIDGGKANDPPPPETDDHRLYRRGKEVLGKNSGGVITKLKAKYGGDCRRALHAIENAALAENANEYIGGVLKGGTSQSFAEFVAETERQYAEWCVS